MTPRLVVPVIERDHVLGRSDAPLTLVEYGDFECPFCGLAYPIVEQLRQRFGNDIRFVFRNFPLEQAHPHAEHAAEAAEAASAEGKFWEMHHVLFEHQEMLDDPALEEYASVLGLDRKRFARELAASKYADRVQEDFHTGVRSGVNGTPTFFINGVRYDGQWLHTDQFGVELARVVTAAHGGAPTGASR
jgi:protein-disulfide isomerase